MVHKDLGYETGDVGRGKQANRPTLDNPHTKEKVINHFQTSYLYFSHFTSIFAVYAAIFVMQLVLVSMASFDELCDENFVQINLAGG